MAESNEQVNPVSSASMGANRVASRLHCVEARMQTETHYEARGLRSAEHMEAKHQGVEADA